MLDPKQTEFDRGFMAGLDAAAQWLDAVPTDIYPVDIFLPVPEERRAKNGVAADLLRFMAPRWAEAVRRIEPPEVAHPHAARAGDGDG